MNQDLKSGFEYLNAKGFEVEARLLTDSMDAGVYLIEPNDQYEWSIRGNEKKFAALTHDSALRLLQKVTAEFVRKRIHLLGIENGIYEYIYYSSHEWRDSKKLPTELKNELEKILGKPIKFGGFKSRSGTRRYESLFAPPLITAATTDQQIFELVCLFKIEAFKIRKIPFCRWEQSDERT